MSPEIHRDGTRAAGDPAEGGFGLVEALVAFVVLAVGLLAVAGIALSVAAQTRDAAFVTDRDLAAHQVLEVAATAGYARLSPGTKDTTVTVGTTVYTVTRTVEQASPRTRKVTVQIPGRGDEGGEIMTTFLHAPRALPSPPPS